MAYTKYRTNTYNNNGVVIGTSDTYKRYSALLSQTNSLDGTDMGYFGSGFIIGEYYTIDSYASGDDFSNIANVIDGDINTSGCYFQATGMTPNVWNEGSYIISDGNLVVQELENTTGLDMIWEDTPFGGEGYAHVFPDIPAPIQYLGDIHTSITNTSPVDMICCWNCIIPSFSSQLYPDYGSVELLFSASDCYGDFDIWDGMLWRASFELRVYNPNPNVFSLSNTSGHTLMKLNAVPNAKTRRVPSRKDNTNDTPVSGGTNMNLIKQLKSNIKGREQFLQAIKRG
jgi:hypothetical protein